jgi:hypothetical protein
MDYVEVVPSGLTNVRKNGTKCLHGIYIPANSLDHERADYCSICRPDKVGKVFVPGVDWTE